MALPAGEWADVEVIENGGGMMAVDYGAVLARARWLRHGGQQAFLKFIVLAGESAGVNTELLTGDVRLRRLQERLTAMQKLGNAIPLVQLLEIRRIEKPAGLLIAMERVDVLHDLLDASPGGDVDLAQRVLRGLSAAREPPFFHFDICPSNIGVRSDGSPVFIDPESLFLISPDGAKVTVPAWKPFRVPQELVVEVNVHLGSGALPPDVAMKKHNVELAMVAAECCIGPLSFRGRGLNFDAAALAMWLASDKAKQHPRLALFWQRELERTLDHRGIRAPIEIASDLSSPEFLTGPPASGADGVLPPSDAVDVVEGSLEKGFETAFDQAWSAVLPTARALRAGSLRPQEIAEYRERLETLVGQFGAQREPWMELLLVIVSYQKNRADAARFIKRARLSVSADPDLKRMERIIDLWAGVE